jgi:cytochrome c556
MKKSFLTAIVAVVAGLASSVAFAQMKPEVMVKQRQAVMTLQGKYWGPMAGMMQGKVPFNLQVVQRNAGYLDNLSRMAWDGFDPATKDVKSAALPAVWSNNAKFAEAAERLQSESNKLYQVSRGGDEAAIKAQMKAVGSSCGACHQDFRAKQ